MSDVNPTAPSSVSDSLAPIVGVAVDPTPVTVTPGQVPPAGTITGPTPTLSSAPEEQPNPPTGSADVGEAEVQAKVDQETDQGFRGTKTDPTPDEHYTFAGAAAGLPTPETDPEHAAKVAAELRTR